MTKVSISGYEVDEETLLTYVDFTWADGGLSTRTVGPTLRGDATRTEIHNELLKQAGFDIDGTGNSGLTGADQEKFDEALHKYADTHKPRLD